MDVLSDVLQAVRLKGAVFFDVRACEPIVAETPPMSRIGHLVMPEAEHVIPFHIMLRGSCWVESTEGCAEPARFCEGDIVIYPHGNAHVFATTPGDRLPANIDNYRTDGLPRPVRMDLHVGGPWTTRFVCGYLACNATPFNPLLEALPTQVLARRPPEGNHIEVDLIQAAVEESEAQRAGRETVLARLSELLFVRVIRRYIEQMPEHSRGWLAGLRDAQVGRALQNMHARPAHDWSLDELARECAMSRAVFAQRFAQCVGETPMRYLARWRMQLAARQLEQPGVSVECVASDVGYRSEAAFSRAFKAIVGMPPGAWRRNRSMARDRIAGSGPPAAQSEQPKPIAARMPQS